MVQANTEITNKLNNFLIEEFELLNRVEAEKHVLKIEKFEELKMKIKPKIVVVNKELADISSIFQDFDDKN
jgi:predicted sulfurtransferase